MDDKIAAVLVSDRSVDRGIENRTPLARKHDHIFIFPKAPWQVDIKDSRAGSRYRHLRAVVGFLFEGNAISCIERYRSHGQILHILAVFGGGAQIAAVQHDPPVECRGGAEAYQLHDLTRHAEFRGKTSVLVKILARGCCERTCAVNVLVAVAIVCQAKTAARLAHIPRQFRLLEVPAPGVLSRLHADVVILIRIGFAGRRTATAKINPYRAVDHDERTAQGTFDDGVLYRRALHRQHPGRCP